MHDQNRKVKIRLLCNLRLGLVGVCDWCQLLVSGFGATKFQDCARLSLITVLCDLQKKVQPRKKGLRPDPATE